MCRDQGGTSSAGGRIQYTEKVIAELDFEGQMVGPERWVGIEAELGLQPCFLGWLVLFPRMVTLSITLRRLPRESEDLKSQLPDLGHPCRSLGKVMMLFSLDPASIGKTRPAWATEGGNKSQTIHQTGHARQQ